MVDEESALTQGGSTLGALRPRGAAAQVVAYRPKADAAERQRHFAG